MKEYLIKMKKVLSSLLITFILITSCTTSNNTNKPEVFLQKNYTAGQNIEVKYTEDLGYESVKAFLVSDSNSIVESYGRQKYNTSFFVNRFF